MGSFRRIVTALALAGLGLLAGLSVFGAFLGSGGAAEMFNSPPLAAFWIALTVLLAAGIAAVPGLVRRRGLLAMHLGCLFILAGGMWGSRAGHDLRRRWLGVSKLPAGQMLIRRGDSENVATELLPDGREGPQWRLPFALRLERCWVEYYLFGGVWVKDPSGRGWTWNVRPIDWEIGRAGNIPFTNVRVRVLKYEPDAGRLLEPTLEVAWPGGGHRYVEAVVGRTTRIDELGVRVKVLRLFRNFKVVRDAGGGRRYEDAPGWGVPAAEIELTFDDGRCERRVAFSRDVAAHARPAGGLSVYYFGPCGADERGRLPGVQVELTFGQRKVRRWIIVRPGMDAEPLALVPLFPEADHAHPSASLLLVRSAGNVRQYRSDLAVLKGRRVEARKVIGVNDPLHYGGYYFYQSGYDPQRERFTVLLVKSDSGWLAVAAGFWMVIAGAVWHCWVRPVLSRLKARRRRAEARARKVEVGA